MSGWTTMTVHPMDPSDDAQKEVIEEWLQLEYGDDAGGYAERTVQIGGYTNESHMRSCVREVFDALDSAGSAVTICANDTSDSGWGIFWTPGESGPHKEEVKYGYEQARGADVVGYFRDEYGARCYASWEA